MPYELFNKLRGPSTIRLADTVDVTLNLSQLSANVNTENIISAIITTAKWSLNPTTGVLTVSRTNSGSPANIVANLYATGSWGHDEVSIANGATGNIRFNQIGPGCSFITISKNASYNVDTSAL
jgi:hypothetical protein